MRILKVWDADYPWDVRIEKVCKALTGAGHEVHMVARNRKGLPLVEQMPEAKVYRMGPLPLMPKKISDASQFPGYLNPRWIRLVNRVADQVKPELVLVRDLPLAPIAIKTARRLGVPCVMDMAENYPAMMQAVWDAGKQRRFDFILRNPRLVKRVEDQVLREIDHVVVVVEESGERLVEQGYPADRITNALNTPWLERLDQLSPKVHVQGDMLKVIYLGLLEAPRGIGYVLQAMRLAQQQGTRVELTLLGDGRERAGFERQASELGLGDSVRFMGFVQYAEAVKMLQAADAGIVPHFANPSWNSTIPNKLFDYMAGALATITSSARPAARIVRDTGAGEVYDYDNPEQLAAAFKRLSSAAYRTECGKRGREAVRNQYNWEMDAARMLAALPRVTRRVP